MRIDWADKRWTIWNMDANTKLAAATEIIIDVPCILVNTENNTHGWLIVNGVWRQVSENQIVIEEKKNG